MPYFREKIRNYDKFFYEPPTLSLDPDFATYPGQLKIERIFQGKTAAFRIQGVENKKEKKIVIISDWSLNLIKDERRRNEVCCLIRDLILEGFDVRYWDGKKALKIAAIEEEIEKQFQFIKAGTTEVINKNIALESDAIFHLDYFDLHELIEDFTYNSYDNRHMLKYKKNVLDINDVLEFEQIPREIYQWIKNKKFILKYHSGSRRIPEEAVAETIKLWLTVFSHFIVEVDLEISYPSLIQQIVKLENLEVLRWQASEIEDLAAIGENHWKNIEPFASKSLKKIELYRSSITLEALELLLRNNTEVEKIRLKFCSNLTQDYEVLFGTLKNLEDLELHESLCAKNISSLISGAPSLKKLYINIAEFPEDFIFKNGETTHPYLETISLRFLKNGHLFVKKIIETSPNIKNLTVEFCQDLKSFSPDEIDSFSLSGLTQLRMEKVGFSAQVISKIISQATELESVTLIDIPDAINLHPDLISHENKFLKLANINVIKDYKYYLDKEKEIIIPISTYLKLVSLSPLVKRVDLSDVINLNTPEQGKMIDKVVDYDFSKVTELNVSNSTITGEVFCILINKMQNIRNLKFSFCKSIVDIEPEDIDDNIIFNNLYAIEGNSSSIRGDTLGKIISKAPNLVFVNIRNCENLRIFSLPDTYNFNFTKIKEFSAKGGDFPLRQYLLLLTHSPMLTTLDLSQINLEQETDDAVFSGIKLSHIKFICISNHPNIGRLFGKLLSLAFNIESIVASEIKSDSSEAYIDEEHLPEELQLISLRVLDLKTLKITGKAIAKLIKASMKITQLNLSSCQWCNDLSHDLIDEAHTGNLTSFSYRDSSLPIATIIKLSMNEKIKSNHYSNENRIDVNTIIIKENYQKISVGGSYVIPKGVLYPSVNTVILGASQLYKDSAALFVSSLLYATPNIKHLELDCSGTNHAELPKELPYLSILKLSKSVEKSVKEHLIAVSPRLQTLEIKGGYSNSSADKTIEDNLLAKHISLDYLEIIDIDDKEISDKFLLNLILRSPQLKKVTLSSINLRTSVMSLHNLGEIDYRNLETIDIRYSKISAVLLIKLLNFSDKIKKITFLNNSFPGLNESEWGKITTVFPALEEISIHHFSGESYYSQLTDHQISGKQFIALLVKSPKLKKVSFQGVRINNLNLEDIPDNLFLENLEVNLSYPNLSEEVIKKLKKFIPRLISYENQRKIELPRLGSGSIYNGGEKNNLALPPDSTGKGFFDSLKKAFSSTSAQGGKNSPSSHNQDRSESSYPNDDNPGISDSSNDRFKKPGSLPSNVAQTSLEEEINSQILTESSGVASKQQLKTKQLFIPNDIHPDKYRLHVIQDVDVTKKQISLRESADKKLVKPKKTIKVNKETLRNEYEKSVNLYQSKVALCETEIDITYEWKSLPAFCGSGAILNFYTDYDKSFEIKYSQTDNLFYIRSLAGKKINSNQKKSKIQFIVERHPEPVKSNWPSEINRIIKYYGEFHPGKPDTKGSSNIDDILNACDIQQIGSCLNRSILCQRRLNQLFMSKSSYLNYKCQLIINSIHAFVEIVDPNNKAYIFNLGGYDADLEIEKLKSENVENYQEIKQEIKVEEPILISHPKPSLKPAEPIIAKKIITEEDIYPGFRTWEKKKAPVNETVEELFNKLVIPGKNSLIKVLHPDDCLKIIAAFGTSSCKKPYFLVDLPDELQWRARGLKFASEHEYRLAIKKHYSKLRHFLKTHPDGVLFINFSQFSATDLTELHSIIDTDRQLESKQLPTELSIVGFYSDNIDNPYNGGDFLTRFTEDPYIWCHPLNVDLYNNRRNKVANPSNEELCVNLYESEDWETLLFGSILIQNKQFSFANHDFITLLENNQLPSLHLKNPPWHLREFQLFWQMALQQGHFILYGKSFSLADDFQLTYNYSYEYDTGVVQTPIKENTNYTHPFNSHTFHEYFSYYEYSKGSFVRKPGLLEQHSHVSLVVTEDMPKEKWSQLLAEANRVENNKQKTTIDIKLTQNSKLPNVLEKMPSQQFIGKSMPLDHKEQLFNLPYAIIKTNLPLLTEGLLSLYPDAMYIKLDTTHNFGDLIYQIHPQITDEEVVALFVKSDPLKELQSGKTVIIEGTLPQQLINALSPLFISDKNEIIIKGKPKPFSGKLFFVTNQHIPWAINQFECNNLNQVQQLFDLKENQAKQVPEKITVKKENNLIQNNAPVEDAQDLSLAACERFEERRFRAIQEGFSKSPIIFYTGPTGIGKSTYFVKEFENDYLRRTGKAIQLYLGEDNLEAFAAHTDATKEPILFIDEANLSTYKLSILKGVKSQRPHILINGHYYPFKGQIILAGNSKKYGGVRQQHDFIDEYAQIVECERPNHAYLYHRILKTQLEKNIRFQEKNFCEDTAKVVLTIFDKINTLAALSNPLLSPRHLHMITVLFNAFCDQFKGINITSNLIIAAACLQIIGDSLPAGKRNILIAYLNKHYGYDESYFSSFQSTFIEGKLNRVKENNFSFTKSRYPILQTLDAFLSMRKQNNFQFGLLLEGGSGIGKSELVKHYLEESDIDHIQFSISKNYETDSELLLNAFYEGKVVIFNELNAGGSRYEKLINSLIMGDDPTGNKKGRERKPGFMVVATQNPIATNPGRQPLSPALQARFTFLQVSEYPASELVSILKNAGINSGEAKDWVDAFMLSIAYANFHHLDPKPNVRTLLNVSGAANGCDPSKIANNLAQVRALVSRARESEVFANIDNINTDDSEVLCRLFLDPSNEKDQVLAHFHTTEDNEEENSVLSENSDVLMLDQELLNAVDYKIKILQEEQDSNKNSRKATRRQIKIDYLQELRENYLNNKWGGETSFTIAQNKIYSEHVFKSFFTSEVEWFANRFERARQQFSENEKITPVNKHCMMNKDVLNNLNAYRDRLYSQFVSSPHARLARRRLEKYTALRKISELYSKQQLTQEHIKQFENDFSQLYDSFLSSKTKKLINSVLLTIAEPPIDNNSGANKSKRLV